MTRWTAAIGFSVMTVLAVLASPAVRGVTAAAGGAGQVTGRPKAQVLPTVAPEQAKAGSSVTATLRVQLPKDVHVQSNKPRDPLLIPTVLTVDPLVPVKVGAITWPKAIDFVVDGQAAPLAVFDGSFVIDVKLTIPASTPPGPLVIPAKLKYQACDATTCFPPQTAQAVWTVTVLPAK
jgi:hypothetical protein